MDFFETNDNSCRICLSNIILVNWNEEIFELCGMTYRDCYFKYTQLEEIGKIFNKNFHNFVLIPLLKCRSGPVFFNAVQKVFQKSA